MKRLVLSLGLLLGGLAGCGSSGGGVGEVNYYLHIKPIADAKCLGCHVAGGIAPMALETYEDFLAAPPTLKSKVKDRTMPPWPPGENCASYYADRSLTQAQIDLVAAWVDQGMPEGDPNLVGDPISVEDVRLSRVDETLTMPVEYTAQIEPDDYRCFLIPWPARYVDPVYVTGFRAVPGTPSVVHHAIAFVAEPGDVATYQALDDAEPGPGYTCFGGSGGPARTWLGAWAPGDLGSDFPPGTGTRVDPGSLIVLQVHYNSDSAGVHSDQTLVHVSVENSVARGGALMPFTNPNWLNGSNMLIPAGQPDVVHTFAGDPTQWVSLVTSGRVPSGQPLVVYSAALHQHQLGRSIQTSIEYADQSSACLLEIPRWDFHWQGGYGLRTPVPLAPGDQIRLECHWDNSAANQPVVNGQPQAPRDVAWGEGTTAEMCLGIYYVATQN